MRIIDINCMIGEWPFQSLRFKTADELSDEMARLGIERAFVFDSHAWLHVPAEGNGVLLEAVKTHLNLVPVFVLTPLVEQEFGGKQALREALEKNNVGAVRLYPSDQSFTLNCWNVERLFSVLDEECVPVLLECLPLGGSIDSALPQLYELATAYPDTPIVLLNPGYRRLRILYPLFERCPNLYMDTSTFIPYRGIEDFVHHFGPGRLLYGSRMPFMEGGVSLGRLLYAKIEPAEREAIAWRNALSLLQQNRLYHSPVKDEAI